MGSTEVGGGERRSKVLKAVELHNHQQWRDGCAQILNEEWPRSKTARLHMLDKSNDQLPYNIALLEESDSNTWTVIGHSRLCKVHGQTEACFVESVVIAKNKRGQGYGRHLMDLTEQIVLSLGFRTVYLTTHDKQHFYHHIGYNYCQPIVSLGSASTLLSDSMMNKLFSTTPISPPGKPHTQLPESSTSTADQPCTSSVSAQQGAPPPPPPAPPPASRLSNKDMPTRMDPSKVSWMKKSLDNSDPND